MAKRGRKKKKQVNINVVIAVMIIASILLAVLIYTNSGFIGEHLSPFLGGIMGYVKYILPIGVFAMAIYIAYLPVYLTILLSDTSSLYIALAIECFCSLAPKSRPISIPLSSPSV